MTDMNGIKKQQGSAPTDRPPQFSPPIPALAGWLQRHKALPLSQHLYLAI